MTTGMMHEGPHDGETVDMPWARLEISFFRFDSPGLEGIGEDTYRLRGPWRGQECAHYDYLEPGSSSK